MSRFPNFADVRQRQFCCYCGCSTETRDHVPAKVFLDKPYPPDLPTVYACRSCNEKVSLDEEYLACLIECASNGIADPQRIERDKIKSILQKKSALALKCNQVCKALMGGELSSADLKRVNNVVLKLARGHSVYELNEPRFDAPSHLAFIPFPSMDAKSRANYEALPRSVVFPEVGSRSMQRLVENVPGVSLWVTVQPKRYRYLSSINSRVIIRIVISEYLACEVVWS